MGPDNPVIPKGDKSFKTDSNEYDKYYKRTDSHKDDIDWEGKCKKHVKTQHHVKKK